MRLILIIVLLTTIGFIAMDIRGYLKNIAADTAVIRSTCAQHAK